MTRLYGVPAVDAAVDQLDWAIRLFLDHKTFISSITLAAAAEGMLEKCLAGIATVNDTAYASIKHALATKGLGSTDQIGRFMNGPRNYFKHADQSSFENEAADLESIAIQQIVRSMINLARLAQPVSSESPRFLDWISANRLDLLEHPVS